MKKKCFLILLSVLILSACDKPIVQGGDTSGTGSGGASRRPSSDTPQIKAMKDAVVQGTRSQVEEIQKMREQDPSNEAIANEEKQLLDLIERIETYPAKDANDLREFATRESAQMMKGALSRAGALLEDKFPTRTSPAPAPGETRAMANPDGTCSQDFLVDMGELMKVALAFAQKMPEVLQSGVLDSEIRSIGQGVANKCEELRGRYASDGSCTLTDENGTRQVTMAELAEACARMEASVEKL